MTCEINYVADDERYETLTMRGVTLCRTEPAAIQDSFSTRLSYFSKYSSFTWKSN